MEGLHNPHFPTCVGYRQNKNLIFLGLLNEIVQDSRIIQIIT